MKKRFLSLALALVMCLSLLPMTALAAGGDLTTIKAAGDIVTFGTVYGEKVEWQVLETDGKKALLIPTEIIGYWPFNEQQVDTKWEDSTLRKWLNNDFLNSVFSESERAAILETTVTNEANPEYGTGGGAATTDKVFLFSISEAEKYSLTAVKFNFTEAQCAANAKQIADRSSEWTHSWTYEDVLLNLTSYVGFTDWCWLRTTGHTEINPCVTTIDYNGSLNYWGEENADIGGLRPGIWVSLQKTEFEASEWAQTYVQQAEELGLIPEVLEGADLTQPINRLEFAAVSVKVYEALSGTAALPAITNPFTDTSDIEVLKAYNLGVTAGTSATTFSPTVLLNREQAATMLTRVFQRVTIPGWPENNPPLEYVKPAAFADDADISDWAKDSVYFMAANGIIAGVGNNRFAPKATTTEQQAQGYAQATREQALTIAVRMVQNLGK